jgi:hypothetical protein
VLIVSGITFIKKFTVGFYVDKMYFQFHCGTRPLTQWHTQPAVRRAEPSMRLLLILALCE